MSILSCTLTGADDTTNLDDLWQLAADFQPGLVEFGVLYSESQQGSRRYPSLAWIERLVTRMEQMPSPRFAIHVCGRAVKDFIAGDGRICEIASAFPCIQVNFRSAEYPVEHLKAMVSRNIAHTIITQHNEANRDLYLKLAGLRNHAVLFDESGGRGIAAEHWPTPLTGVNCGYAGGLGPDNLATQLEAIHSVAQSGELYWVDMEGKLRDNQDRFDIQRARVCLDIVKTFCNEQKNNHAAPIFR